MFPRLIKLSKPQIDIYVTLYAGEYNEDGAPEKILDNEHFKCIYQGSVTRTFNNYGTEPQADEKAYIDGDIAQGKISAGNGEAVIFGETREITKIHRERDIDGDVNYTVLFMR